MSLTIVWTIIIAAGIITILTSCLPNAAVEWLVSKFEIHSKLSEANVIVTVAGKRLEGDEKIQIVHCFNEAIFLKRYNIISGTEDLHLHPKNNKTPFVIDTKKGKKEVRLLVFPYTDHIDVVKKYKRKIVAYSLFPDSRKNCSIQ